MTLDLAVHKYSVGRLTPEAVAFLVDNGYASPFGKDKNCLLPGPSLRPLLKLEAEVLRAERACVRKWGGKPSIPGKGFGEFLAILDKVD